MGRGSFFALSSEHGQGFLSVNLAVFFFGLAGILGKLTGLSAPEIVFGRVLIAGMALIGLGVVRKGGLAVRSRADLAILVIQGIILAGHWTAFFQAVLVSSVATGLLSYSSFPLFVALIEGWVMRERVARSEVVAAVLVLPGVALLVPRLSLNNSTTVGVAWGIFAGLTFAVLSIVNRRLSQRYDSRTISAYQDGVAALALLPLVLTIPEPRLTAVTIALLLGLGLPCTALAHTLFIAGLRHVSTPIASLIATLEPVWGIGLGAAILCEFPDFRAMIGGAIILGALALPALTRLGALRSPGGLTRRVSLGGSRRRP